MTKITTLKNTLFFSICSAAIFGACAPDTKSTEELTAPETNSAVKENTGRNETKSTFASQPLWGDTHLHTSYSFDVYLFGTPTSTPENAYRFARGEKVSNPTTGEQWQLDRPLDFLMISDHAEALGSANQIFTDGSDVAKSKSGLAMRDLANYDMEGMTEEGLLKAYHFLQTVGTGAGEDKVYGVTPVDLYTDLHAGEKRNSAWFDLVEKADHFNDPGKFTTFIGWEWTSHPGGANLHRNIITPTNAETAKTFLPFSGTESNKPEDLWNWLDKTSESTGADFIAIPHNPNVSAGLMFDVEDSEGNAIDADYARRRAKWEKIVEVTQIKGDSETHPLISPNDEFADFETWNFVMLPDGPTPDPVAAEYARSGLIRGLEIEKETGVNPYKFGMIGSTDSHTGLTTSSETNFAGKGQKDSRPSYRDRKTGLGSSKGWDMGAAGLVAAWAPDNSRQSIFDAFKRKEVYATTGTRISLRVLAGQTLDDADLSANKIGDAYARNTPMGGELTYGEAAPKLLIQALKDPSGANLDRVQVVKGWVDSAGDSHEKVTDIAWSDNRKILENGRLPAVGNTVDLTTGAYENSIGSSELSTVWTDPDFDPDQSAVYYVRVLEIPTPRYSLLDSIAMGIDYKSTGRPATLQERAYSSPIWYNAKK